jgi:ribosomal protein S18 acetylase RimI-like enzyme
MTADTDNSVVLPDAPAIPGLRFRRFRGEADYAPMVAAANVAYTADQLEEVLTVEELARYYSTLKNCDPYQDVLIIEVDGQVVGYHRVTWWEETALDESGTGTPDAALRAYAHFGVLLPAWRGQGIEPAVFHHAERRLRAIAADHPPCPARFLQTWNTSTQRDLGALILQEGYAPVRYFYDMVRPTLDDIPDLPLPPGLEVRPVEPDQYRTIWEAEVEAFHDHWGNEAVDEEDFERWTDTRRPTFQPHLWQVAWDGDQVAGMIRNFIDQEANAHLHRKRGYTEDISVRRPWRRRGLARALLARSLRLLRDEGMTEAALGVDTANPSGALRLYEDMGFRTVRESIDYRKPL